MYRGAGLPCEIEAGRAGLVVYGPTRAIVTRVANKLATSVRQVAFVGIENAVHERDEQPATAWVATVRFNWDELPLSMTACVALLGKSVMS